MKKVPMILTMVIGCSLLASCEKETILAVNISSLSFDNGGGRQAIDIVANKVWRASSNQSWCKVSPFSGDGSDNSNFTLSVSCDANTTYDSRSCTITITCEELTSTISVTQAEGKGLIVSQTEYSLTNEEQAITVEVQANVQYTVSIDDACKDWIKQESTKGLSSNTIKFAISKNESYDNREGKITIKQTDGTLSGTVVVKQSQTNGLFFTTTDYSLSNEQHTLTVDVTTNVELEVKPDVDWIKYVKTKGLKTSQIVLNVSANDTYDAREGKVQVKQKNGDLSGVITIRQEQNNGILVSQTEYNLSYEAQTIDVEVKYNVDFDVVIPDSCTDWVSIVKTKGLSSRHYIFALSENASENNRECSITFKQKNGFLSGTVLIKQSAVEVLTAERNEYAFSCEKQAFYIKVTSNVTYMVVIDDSCKDWIEVDDGFKGWITSNGLSWRNINFHIISDNEGKERIGKIYLVSEYLQREVIIRQYENGVVVFEDDYFRAFCLQHYDKDKDGKVSYSEALAVSEIDCSLKYSIKSLGGIEWFKNLKILKCGYNYITQIDVSGFPLLEILDFASNQVSHIDLSKNTLLLWLNFGDNQFSEIDVSKNSMLGYFVGYGNHLTKVDLSNNPNIMDITCYSNYLTEIDLSHSPQLQSLSIAANQLLSIDLSNNPLLTYIDVSENQLTTLDISNNPQLDEIQCKGNRIKHLDASNNIFLRHLEIKNGEFSSVNVESCIKLEKFYCSNNQITSLDLSHNIALAELKCESNMLTSLNISNTSLRSLNCSFNYLSSLDCTEILQEFSMGTGINCTNNPFLKEVWLNKKQTYYMTYDKQTTTLKYEVPIPDAAFKSYCLTNFDKNGDGRLSTEETESCVRINCVNDTIKSLEGIEYFTNLTSLGCQNNQITNLDVSKNKALTYLSCHDNQIRKLDLSNNPLLEYLYCGSNYLSALDVSHNPKLIRLFCYDNQLTVLDVRNNTQLTGIMCYDNATLSTFNIGNNNNLKEMECHTCRLSTLDVSGNPSFETLKCYNNPQLKEIWLKTNQTIPTFVYDKDVATIKYK